MKAAAGGLCFYPQPLTAHRAGRKLEATRKKSVEEASGILDVPAATVKTRMFYARKQLAELLKGAGVDSLAA